MRRRSIPGSQPTLAALGFAALLLCVRSQALHAQLSSTLTITSGTISFPAPTPADLTAGILAASAPATFQVTPAAAAHTTTVTIKASGTTMGGSKSIADLQWRRGDLGTWQSLTQSDVFVESRTYTLLASRPAWQNTIYFRVVLRWTGEPPATYVGSYVITLTQTLF
jgi:hypothetical protein